MFNKLLALAAFSVAAFAQSSDVVITGLTGSAQTLRPIVLARYFAVGEIPHYAKPTIAGVGVPSSWQNDVKTRWRDGPSAARTITGATNAAPIRITATAHGFQEGEIVTIASVGGNTAANGTFTIRNITTDAFDLLNSTGNGAYTSGGTATGPSAGSVQIALISFPGTIGASPDAKTVTFSDDTDQCSDGDTAACNAASLDFAGMLAFNGGTWLGTTAVTAGGTTYTFSARTMLTDDNCTYWQRGPYASVVVCEDGTAARTYDAGYTCTANCTGTYGSSTWTADATNRSLHPVYVLTFFTGWAGVKVEYIVANYWTTALQDQKYAVVLANSSGTVFDSSLISATSTGLVHYGRTQWRRTYWDGSEPGGAGNERAGLKINYSLAYLIYSKAILPYDQTLDPSSASAGYASQYTAGTIAGLEGMMCPVSGTRCGNIQLAMTGTGARPDIGPIAGWDVNRMYTWDPSVTAATLGDSDFMGLVPIHLRESSAAKPSYDLAGVVPSISQTMSMDSRRTFRSSDMCSTVTGCFSGTDPVIPVATLSTGYRWAVDYSHFPSTLFLSYLTTGDWFYWNLQQNVGAWMLALSTSNVTPFKRFAFPSETTTRGNAWALREGMITQLIAPDGTPEKNYYMQKANNWMAYQDGAINNTASKFYWPAQSANVGTETSPWGFGRAWLGTVSTGNGWPNPLGLSPGNSECSDLTGLDTGVIPSTAYCGKPFMWDYYIVVTHWLKRQGYPVDAIRARMAPWVIEQTQDPTACIYCATQYNQGKQPGNVTSPVLTAGINSSTLTIPVDTIPATWQTPPYVVIIGTEPIKIVSVNVPGLTLTANSTANNGRGFWGKNAASHAIASPVLSFEYFQTWADQKTGYATPLLTDWYWTGGISQSYTTLLLAATAGYVSSTSGGYSGQTIYDTLRAALLTNSDGQYTAYNNDPGFAIVADADVPVLRPPTLSGKTTIAGKGSTR